MKCSLGISNFLEEISSLSHSIVFLYFFALITNEGFLISPAILWNSALKWVYLSFSPLPFPSLLFSAVCKASIAVILPFCISFSWGWSWSLLPVQSWSSIHSSSSTLSIRSNILSLFFTSTVLLQGISFRSYLNGLTVFPTFFNLSLNFSIRSSWSELLVLFFASSLKKSYE